MTYKVSPVDLSHITLNETDTVKSVLQNVAIILATMKGSCPMYREFGIATDVLDKPMPVAKALLRSEIKEAVEEFEPRVEVSAISFEEDLSSPGRLIPTVEVNIRDE